MSDYIPSTSNAVFYREWLRAHATSRDLVVDESAIGMIIEGHASVPFLAANSAPWKLEALLREGLYDHIYVCRTFTKFDREDSPGNVTPNEPLTPTIRLKTLAVHHPRTNMISTISEVVSVDGAAAIIEEKRPSEPEKLPDWRYLILL
jgi:hypothetical protein